MKRLFLILTLIFLFAPAAASAYVASPRWGAFELKFGPYRPAVDDSFNDSDSTTVDPTPYQDTFGGGSMFLTVLELDWQFVRPPGFSLGIGGSAGFMQDYAKSRILNDDGSLSDETSADYTVLNVIPFAALAVIRVDVLNEELGIPLVPFFKIGLNWYLWWILNGGDTATVTWTGDDDQEHYDDGVGGTLGWQFSTGLMFCLDSFDRMSARTFDNEVGVNHSYLFAEFLWADVDGFGRDGYMNLSTDNFGGATIMAGVALEF